MTVVRIALANTRTARMALFQRNAGPDDKQARSRAAGTLANGGSRLDLVDADIKAEREMLFDEPSRAAAVVRRRHRLAVGGRLGRTRRMQRPPCAADAAAQVAPPAS